MVPWPHMSIMPTLLKKITPAAHSGSCGSHKQGADQHVGAARLVDDARAEGVELLAKQLGALRQRPAAEVRPAGDDDARRLAAGVRVDDGNALHGSPPR